MKTYQRTLKLLPDRSYFLFGPRGTGKSFLLQANQPDAIYLDLLDSEVFFRLQNSPKRLESYILPDGPKTIIIDEVQKIPKLLDEVHRLIETARYRFILTGSSARKLKAPGTNLLAGRALMAYMFPLTVSELGDDFHLATSLRYGHLPTVFQKGKPDLYLQSYIGIYLKEEVSQEGIARNLEGFSRFLEIASFSQGETLNITQVSRECDIPRKTVEGYFYVLEDLLLAVRIPVFTKRAKRRMGAAS